MSWIDSLTLPINLHVQQHHDQIAKEAEQCWNAGLYIPHAQSRMSNKHHIKLADEWYQFDLRCGVKWSIQAQAYTPHTVQVLNMFHSLLSSCKNGRCYFSCIPAHSVVEGHTGYKKIRNHLPCLLPGDPKLSWMMVGNTKKHWQMGQVLSFDDSSWHYVENQSDHCRIVLIYDIPFI